MLEVDIVVALIYVIPISEFSAFSNDAIISILRELMQAV